MSREMIEHKLDVVGKTIDGTVDSLNAQKIESEQTASQPELDSFIVKLLERVESYEENKLLFVEKRQLREQARTGECPQLRQFLQKHQTSENSLSEISEVSHAGNRKEDFQKTKTRKIVISLTSDHEQRALDQHFEDGISKLQKYRKSNRV